MHIPSIVTALAGIIVYTFCHEKITTKYIAEVHVHHVYSTVMGI